jgi:hypothetical protein
MLLRFVAGTSASSTEDSGNRVDDRQERSWRGSRRISRLQLQ